MADNSNHDFLRFNAYSIKDLIIKKLSEDTNFTDQVYPGSNLNILIDLVSYVYQVLIFNLNNAAAESMFADTQIYENINRLCQFIGYNPKGMSPSSAMFHITEIKNILKDGTDDNILTIPMFSYIKTGKTDNNGKEIYYSIAEEKTFSKNSYDRDIKMYNGIWTLYNNVFTASGDDWETFTLDGLKSDASNNEFVSHAHIKVFVDAPNNILNNYGWFNQTPEGLFKSPYISNRIYQSDDKIFNVRLNEDKTYVITFGDGFRGIKLPAGALIYVFYLDTNGFNGNIAIGSVNESIKSAIPRFHLTTEQAIKMFGNYAVFNKYSVKAINTSSSSNAVAEESVNDIRAFAPNWFRMGNRLVTKSDYEYYIKNSIDFKSEIEDVVCMNNWEYISTFYKWLYNLGIQKHKKANYYLNQNRIIHAQYEFADPADCNNIYLWITKKSENINATNSNKHNAELKDKLTYVKDLTHEPVFLNAVEVNFAICAADDDTAKSYLKSDFSDFDYYVDSYIEITLDDLNIYSNMSISKQVAQCIYDYFKTAKFHIGDPVNFNDMQNKILELNGISRIRTIFKNPIDCNNIIIRNGLSFASWTANSELIDVGDDMEVSNSIRTLEPFQIPVLPKGNIENIIKRIKIIKRSTTGINHVQY